MDEQGRPSEPLHPERALVHPAWWIGLGLMAFNDHVLKAAGLLPQIVTGKLSDFAGLFVAPALMATVLRARTPKAIALCHFAVGAVFAGIKLSRGFADMWSALMGLFGFPWTIVCDPTDLLALPMLLLAWRVLRPAMGADAAFLRRGAERMLAAVGLLFCVATSDEETAPPPPEEPEPPPPCQDQDADGWCAAEDCDDLDAAVHGCPCVDFDLDGICQSFDCDDANANVWDDCDAGTCDDAFIIEGSSVDTTAFSADEIAGSCGATGGERVYAFDVIGEVNVLRIVRATVSSLRPHAIEVRDDCAVAETALACGEAAADHSVEVLALPGTRLYIIVEAATYEDQTDFELSMSSLPLVCGDGIPAGPEECDDGNMLPGDGCDAECRSEP